MYNKNITHLSVGHLATNCWIYPTGAGEAAVIDPGDDAQVIIDTLKKLSLAPKYILLTHGHFDHIAAIPHFINEFYDKPKIAIHRYDSHYLGSDSYKSHFMSVRAALGSDVFLDALWAGMPFADILLDDGSEIGPFTVLNLPGHSQGSVAFWDKETNTLFTGDTLFKGSYGRTDLPEGNEDDMLSSLRRLFEMDPDIKVYPGHGDTTTIGKEAGKN